MNNWIVHKFGGSSIGNLESFKLTANLVMKLKSEYTEDNLIVVLSAIGGVTDLLLKTIEEARIRDKNYLNTLNKIKTIYLQIAKDILDSEEAKIDFDEILDNDIGDLLNILRSIWVTKTSNEVMSDFIVGYGEIWSTKLMHIFMMSNNVSGMWVDSRNLIVSTPSITGPVIDWVKSEKNLTILMNKMKDDFLIFPGFIASTPDGLTTTLGRNGSDFTASILGVLLNSSEINIWTDVNGIYSANPKRVPNAVVLEKLSYLESLELAYFGAEVIHPGTISTIMESQIPIVIRNTFNPKGKGTTIKMFKEETVSQDKYVKGFATINSISIVNLEGAGMIGVPGISEKLFQSLKNANISVTMISQASSEYSICVAVNSSDGIAARKTIEKAFSNEIRDGHVQSISIRNNCAILAVIGDKMVNQPGIASILFSALSRSRVNVLMISQGSSERNISVVVDQNDLSRGLRAVHSAYYLSHLTISVGIIGIGLIGKSLLNQINYQLDELRNNLNIDIHVKGLANSKRMLIESPIQLDTWEESFKSNSVALNINNFTDEINTDLIPHSVIIDCSASDEVAKHYEKWLNEGIHVITPNKKANSGDWGYYKELSKYIMKGPSTNPLDKSTHYFYETTVGAGLPIISTLRDLILTGDEILEITGIFSGTLSYIFNELSPDHAFSEIVKRAHKLGYTEPDPRDDLSGIDFARKLVILGREIGLKIELKDVVIEPLIPEDMFDKASVSTFFDNLQNHDQIFVDKMNEVANRDKVLRYVGSINKDGKMSIRLEEFEKEHPFANLKGSENIVSFKTKRYLEYPLVVHGPGAGSEVTSGGIFAELLRLAEILGNT